ncbi:MAG: hypothetical protein U9R31_00545 [Candidatus Omnitrophota bacterium]|nr:hypothetical protein [Candidatus Omnitrophota bacterium]
MIKRFLFCVLIFLSFASSAFPWQINCFQEGEPFTGEQKQITLNLVFVLLNYQNESEFKKDISSIIARLKNTSPFDEFKGLKVYLLDTALKEREFLFKKSKNFPFLKVKNNLIQSIKRNIKGVYKLVILDKEGDVGAAELSNIRNISLIILGKKSYGKKKQAG